MNSNARAAFAQITYVIVALVGVTAMSEIWFLLQTKGPLSVIVLYLIFGSLMLVTGFVLFRAIVRRIYLKNGRATPFSVYLQCQIWGLYFAFPCIYNPYEWAWSSSHPAAGALPLIEIGVALVIVGIIAVVVGIGWLGLRQSGGLKADHLMTSGLYRITRNPQIVAGTVIVLGYGLLWPSWYTLGWMLLYAALAHMMILTEEEHLHNRFGEEYEGYRQRVPRYLGFPQHRPAAHESKP